MAFNMETIAMIELLPRHLLALTVLKTASESSDCLFVMRQVEREEAVALKKEGTEDGVRLAGFKH